MASGLYIDTRQLGRGAAMFERLTKELPDRVSDVLNKNAKAIELNTKRAAPADRGQLRQNINVIDTNPLQKHITSHAPYSAYIEFGTGKYAAQYVGTLPGDYKAFAASFKGSGGGTFKEFIRLLAEWVNRKGIVGTYSIKTKRRTGSKATKERENLQVAYAIAISILRNGVHPHPFMIPALIDQQPIIVRDMTRILNTLK
jgi:hypothetical protein